MKKYLILLGLLAAGCGGGRAPLATDDAARQALEATLNAWRDGKPPGLVAESPTAIQATDSRWQSGEQLASYTIGPAEPSDGGRTFPVKLAMKKPPGDQDARYVVIGAGPIFVYRFEDYQTTTNMDNGPAVPKGAK